MYNRAEVALGLPYGASCSPGTDSSHLPPFQPESICFALFYIFYIPITFCLKKKVHNEKEPLARNSLRLFPRECSVMLTAKETRFSGLLGLMETDAQKASCIRMYTCLEGWHLPGGLTPAFILSKERSSAQPVLERENQVVPHRVPHGIALRHLPFPDGCSRPSWPRPRLPPAAWSKRQPSGPAPPSESPANAASTLLPP